ncbi:unnamed protein product, partial [Effrenium voratum]
FKDWALLSMCLGAVFVISQPKAGPFGSGFPTESLFLPGMQRFCAQVPPTDRPIASLHHGSLLWTYPAGRGCGLCSPSLSGTSHLSQRGGRPGGGHRGGAGALGGAAAGPRLRQRGGHAAELVGGRHLPRADLRRCICGGFGQPPHQAPYGGEVRGGFHEVSLCPWGFAGMQAAKLHSSHRFKLRRSSELRNNGVQLETAVGNWTQRARIFRGRRTRCE